MPHHEGGPHVIRNDSWREHATCAEVDPDLFLGDRNTKKARTICNGTPERPGCPVRDACLLDALTEEATHRFGPWLVLGGMTPAQRRDLPPKDRQALINQLTQSTRTTTRPGDPRT